jgi:hypothetical protein
MMFYRTALLFKYSNFKAHSSVAAQRDARISGVAEDLNINFTGETLCQAMI